jgi:amicyanin
MNANEAEEPFLKGPISGRQGVKTMKRSVSMAVVVVVLALGFTGPRAEADQAAPAAQANPAPTEVKIDNFSFGPAELTVRVGTTVKWTNRDDIPHTVVSTEKVFKSKVLDTDETFSFTFNQAGTYPYFCSIHPKMTGKVVVQ